MTRRLGAFLVAFVMFLEMCFVLEDSVGNKVFAAVNSEEVDISVTRNPDGQLEIKLCEEEGIDCENNVVGQAVITLSIASAGLITAAEYLLAATAKATVKYVSANAIATVITGIQTNTQTYKSYSKISTIQAARIRLRQMAPENAYFEADLSGNTVMIGKQISEWEAVSRLERGYDIFCTSAYAAGWVALNASTWSGKFYSARSHDKHDEGGYPHFHAGGRRWYKNAEHSPHAWYPF